MKKFVIYFVVIVMFCCNHGFELKASAKKSQQTFACSQHGKNCNGNHGKRSKR